MDSQWTDEELKRIGKPYAAPLKINKIGGLRPDLFIIDDPMREDLQAYDRSTQHGNSQLDQGSPRKQ
jgi:hypothetical protein